MEYAVDLRATR